MRRSAVLLLLVCSACAPGCGDDGGGGGSDASVDAGMTADARPPCTKRWNSKKIGTAATSSATVEGGFLVLRSSMSAQTDLRVVTSMMTLSGDFTLTVRFRDFVPGGLGAFVQAAISDPTITTNAPLAAAGIGNFPQDGLSATFQPGTADLKPTPMGDGLFRFTRTGAMVTINAATSTGSPTAAVAAAFTMSPLQIGLQIGTNNSTFNPESLIRFSDVTVSGGGAGGAAQNDSFDCDSLVQQ